MSDPLRLLFNRHYWLDEWHTMLVASRPSLSQVFADLYNGSDFAPPFVHLTLWLLRAFAGGELPAWLARGFALACAIAAVAFTYHALRRRFGRGSALAGALAVGSHAMLISYAFEARFYAPWLMFAAMFAWSLGIVGRRARFVAGALAAIGLCTTHWFGVVTLGLMCLGALVYHPEPDPSHPERSEGSALRARLDRVAPALAGVVALLACLPLLLGQRASVQEPSWIQGPSWNQFARLADTFWGSLVPVGAAAIIAILLAVRSTHGRARAALGGVARDPSLAALLALAAMPLALAALSLLQPVMLDRYALTALLAWAPLVAAATHLIPRVARAALLVAFGIVTLAGLGAQVSIERQVEAVVRRDEAVLREQCGRGTVAFTTRLQMYYHTEFIRRECPTARYLAITNDKLERLYRGPNERVRPQFRTENEFALMHGRMYGFPQVVWNTALDSLDRFVVMAEPSSVPRDGAGRERFSPIMFPGHHATLLNGNGILYERR